MKKKVLFLTNSNNCMSQRLSLELRALNHQVNIHLASSELEMLKSFEKLQYDIVFCPFLTRKVPPQIYKSGVPCIIVHPGIKGDRGISSLDWAIYNKSPEWGVTLLQAVEQMDAGPIWSSKTFTMPCDTTKSYIYRTLVVQKTVEALKEFLFKYDQGIKPDPLNYDNPDVKGTFMPKMKDKTRTVAWDEPLQDILRKIRCSDSDPGAIGSINGKEFRLFNVFPDKTLNKYSEYEKFPIGSVIGQRDDAICLKTKDSPLWISHLKDEKAIKLPAMHFFPRSAFETLPIPKFFVSEKPETFQEIFVIIQKQEIAHIHFRFLNGAMNTSQCLRLRKVIETIAQLEKIKIIVLRGGKDFFSNGINLNTIEASKNPELESMRNILAINDCIREIFSAKNKITVAYLEGNAGAGGAMMPLAADFVWASPNVILNAHYKGMGLSGSEYWTYFLKKRIGVEQALKLTEELSPVLARNMVSSGMIDKIIYSENELDYSLEVLIKNYREIIKGKIEKRDEKWFSQLENCRNEEIANMKENFAHRDYHRARSNFVHKICPKGMVSSNISQDIPGKNVIDCKKFVEFQIKNKIIPKIKSFKEKYNEVPAITIFQVGNNLESTVYVQNKQKLFEENGFKFKLEQLMLTQNERNLEEKLRNLIKESNDDPNVHGIIVQLPLPVSMNTIQILESIHPIKNIDGFHSNNYGRVGLSNYFNGDYILPCAVRGIIELLDFYDIKTQGKNIVVIGKGLTVGLPLSLYLINQGATVTVCNKQTVKLEEKIAKADLIISATNCAHIINPDWLTPKSIIIDVGTKVIIGKNNQRIILGNLQSENLQFGYYTPVPGGIGRITVVSALLNTCDAFEKLKTLNK